MALQPTAVSEKLLPLLNLSVSYLQNGVVYMGKHIYFKLAFYKYGD